MSVASATPTRATTSTRPRRLGARTRKAVLVVHIVSAGSWIGLDVVMAVLVFTGLFTGDNRVKALCFQVLELIVIWPLLSVGLLCLVSGVVLGLGSKYGLVRYWWVAAKLVINVLFNVLVLVSLRPGAADVAEQGRRLADGDVATIAVGGLVFPPIVSPTMLIVAVLLSVYKPWGRIRRRNGC